MDTISAVTRLVNQGLTPVFFFLLRGFGITVGVSRAVHYGAQAQRASRLSTKKNSHPKGWLFFAFKIDFAIIAGASR